MEYCLKKPFIIILLFINIFYQALSDKALAQQYTTEDQTSEINNNNKIDKNSDVNQDISPEEISSIIDKFIDLQVHKGPEWHALLYYSNVDLFGIGRYKSEVDGEGFFLSKDGKVNPKSELIATLNAFLRKDKKVVNNIEQYLVCEYPSRFTFLNSIIDISNYTVKLDQCGELQQWLLATQDYTNASIVFAAGFLGSAASMYGHTLLRINQDFSNINNNLLSISVNFGAVVDVENELGIRYILYGIFGGYYGSIAVQPYAQKIREYNNIENRDLWEFELSLTKEEIDFLLLHLWEIRETKFEYYFFDENCSYRILTILKVLRPDLDIGYPFPIITVPLDTVKYLDDEGLIKNTNYRSSIINILYNQSLELPESHQYFIEDLTQGNATVEDSFLQNLDATSQANILEFAYQYIRIQDRDGSEEQRKIYADRALPILIARSKIDAKSNFKDIEVPDNPINGHDTSRFNISYAGNSFNEDIHVPSMNIQLRSALHEATDWETGYLPNMKLKMLDIELRAYNIDISIEDQLFNEIELERLEYIAISSFTPFYAPLFRNKSWSISALSEQDITSANSRSIIHKARGGMGAMLANSQKDLALYGLLGFYTHASSDIQKGYSFGPLSEIGAFSRSFLGQSSLAYEYYLPVLGDNSHRQVLNLKHAINFGPNFQIIAFYKNNIYFNIGNGKDIYFTTGRNDNLNYKTKLEELGLGVHLYF